MSCLRDLSPSDKHSSRSDAGLQDEEKQNLERALLRKLDFFLVPWPCLLYLMCFLDRANIGNAKIAHLEQDLNINPKSFQFSETLIIFFVSYAIFEPLSNLLLKKWRPSRYIPSIMILWGCTMLGMGFVKNWSGLMAARWFLGMVEAGMFPGIVYYLSCWYKRDEIARRVGFFVAAAALAGTFGGFLAAAIQKMNGLGGIAGWAWIFIIEGLLTIVLGAVSYFMIHDFPGDAKFLSPEENARVINRLREDKQHLEEEFSWNYLLIALKDWKTYIGMLMYMGAVMPLYSFALFLPSIIESMSFVSSGQTTKIQLLSVPPNAAAAILTVILSFWSDGLRKRGVFIMACSLLGLAGFAMLISSTNPAIQYTGTFLAAMGVYPPVPLIITWVANNIQSVYTRGVVLGFVIGWGNLNGVVSSVIYQWAPRYFLGYGLSIAYLAVGLLGGAFLFTALLRRENKKRSELEKSVYGDDLNDFLYTM